MPPPAYHAPPQRGAPPPAYDGHATPVSSNQIAIAGVGREKSAQEAKAQDLKFFRKVREVNTERDYSILVDQVPAIYQSTVDWVQFHPLKFNAIFFSLLFLSQPPQSGSMSGGRWKQALEAVQSIAPHTCDCDADGISLYFFNNRYEKIENVRTSEEVMKHFAARSPGGGTKLAGVLEDAVKPEGVDRSGKRRPETLLVISDGEPSDRDEVERVIINATKQYMSVDEDLSITFIQVGNDKDAEKWLAALDDDLQSKGAL